MVAPALAAFGRVLASELGKKALASGASSQGASVLSKQGLMKFAKEQAVEAGQRKITGAFGGGGGGGGGGPSMMGQGSAEAGIKTAINKGFDKTFGMIPGVKKFKDSIQDTVGVITKWSKAMINSSQALQRYNGTIANAVAKFEQAGLIRSFKSAGTTGEGRASQMQSYSELLDEVQQFEDAFTNVANAGLTIATNVLTHIVVVAKAMPGVQAALDLLAKDKPSEDLPWEGFLKHINSGDTTKPNGVFFERANNMPERKKK